RSCRSYGNRCARPGDAMIKTERELAVLGGQPLFTHPLHVGRPNIPDRAAVLKRIAASLDRAWLTNDGPLVRELEAKLSDYIGVRHCVAMANATVAMEVLARALELTGEVIVPAFTFIATPHAFSWLGLQPVFCDVNRSTHMIDVRSAERMITERTSAIAAVHLWGGAADVEALDDLATRHNLALVYDSAHALGASAHGKRVGGFGDAEVFSFHATKFFNTFEGGAVTTNNDGLAERLRLLRNFGFAGYDNVIAHGTNAKLSEAHAAMGLTMIEHVEALSDRNGITWRRYAEALPHPGVKLLRPIETNSSNYQYVVCEVTDDAPLTRDQLLNVLWQENVRARRYFFPGCHRTEPYAGANQTLPVTEEIAARVLVLPAGALITADEIAKVVHLIERAFENAARLRDRLPEYMPPGAFKA
ncbi:MAG TPA: aminotransferase class I/II-fold pyridoxal phosphate-dependent enzyme, partial [Longimicrobiales bacterium]